MFAIIESGGKQYRVEPGDVIDVELGAGDSTEGVAFDRVLLVSGDDGVQVGDPVVSGARVMASLIDQVRAPKILVFKKKRRKGYKRLQGHRQDFQRVRINEIQFDGAAVSPAGKGQGDGTQEGAGVES